MPTLYSYVVDHDNGFAPNPSGGLCTLAKCKYGTRRRNVVEMAREGDWIVGTGGSTGFKRGESANVNELIYAMRVDRKITLSEYCREYRNRRIDAEPDEAVADGRFALISKHFFYFGRNAIDISEIPDKHLDRSLVKRGQGYRSKFPQAFIEEFSKWLSATFAIGVHGLPCKPRDDVVRPKCLPIIKRKSVRAK
jgi:Nucleotide modification associated domain 2